MLLITVSDTFEVVLNVGKVIFVALCFLFIACAETEQPKIDCSLVSIDLRVAGVDYADCGLANGKVFLRVNGGEEPYAYSLKGEAQAGALFSELRSDFYTFYVADRNGCTDSVTTFVGSKEGVTATAKITASGCEDDKGMIEVTARNGVEPYRYQLGENGDYTTSPVFENLPSGSYSIWVADGNDCRSHGILLDVGPGCPGPMFQAGLPG